MTPKEHKAECEKTKCKQEDPNDPLPCYCPCTCSPSKEEIKEASEYVSKNFGAAIRKLGEDTRFGYADEAGVPFTAPDPIAEVEFPKQFKFVADEFPDFEEDFKEYVCSKLALSLQAYKKQLLEEVEKMRKKPISDEEIENIPFGAQVQEQTVGYNKALTDIKNIIERG